MEDTEGAKISAKMYSHCNVDNPGIPADVEREYPRDEEMNPLTNNIDKEMSSTAIRQLCSLIRPEWKTQLDHPDINKYAHPPHVSRAEILVSQKKVTSPTDDASYKTLYNIVGKHKYVSPGEQISRYANAEQIQKLKEKDYELYQSIMVADMLWLVERCLEPDPVTRITTEEALSQSRFLQIGKMIAEQHQKATINSIVAT